MSLPFPDIRLNIYLVCDVEGALSGRWYVEFFPRGRRRRRKITLQGRS